MKSKENLIGAWAFLVGVILAIIIGLFQTNIHSISSLFYIILVILGVLVGLLNVADRDLNTFLIASVALVIVSGLGNNTLIFVANISPILSSLSNVLSALLVMFIPATIIVALKVVFAISSNI